MNRDWGTVEIHPRPEGLLIHLRVSAGAARERLAGPHGGRLKVAVREAPERGKANRAVLDLLSRVLDVPRRDLTISAGETSPDKACLVRGVEAADLGKRIRRALGAGDNP